MKKLHRQQCLYDVMLFIMKISITPFLIVLMFSSLAFSNGTTAQGILDKEVTLRIENIQLKNALNRIEKSVGAKFAYSPNIVRDLEKVTLNADKEKLGDLLRDLLTPMGISFQLIADRISLFKTPKDPSAATSTIEGFSYADLLQVTGKVSDENGAPLPGVNILIKGTTRGTTSDAEGNFSIEVDDANAILVFSFIGFQLQEV